MEDRLNGVRDRVLDVLSVYGLSVVAAIVMLVIGFAAAGWLSRLSLRALGRTRRVDATLNQFLASLIRYSVIAFTIIVVLNQFGVQTASLITVIGAAGLAIGLALQGTLSNIAAGVMLLLLRPFRVGQYIDAGEVAGTVESITLFLTELNTADNVHIVTPNSKLWGPAIRNYSHNATRRMDIVIGIGYGSDIGRACEVINALLAADPRTAAEPAPAIYVTRLGDNAVELTVRLWCAASDMFQFQSDLTRRIKEGLDEAGIDLPFPQRTVHVVAPPDSAATLAGAKA